MQGECDGYVIDSGVPYTLLRPRSFLQNFLRFHREAIRRGVVPTSQGDGRTPFIDARDVAAVAAEVLANPAAHAGKAYVLTGPEALTNGEALAIVGEAIGKRVSLAAITEAEAAEAMRRSGIPEAVVEMMSSLNEAIAAGEAEGVTDSVLAITGRDPRTLRAFAREYAEAWRQGGAGGDRLLQLARAQTLIYHHIR